MGNYPGFFRPVLIQQGKGWFQQLDIYASAGFGHVVLKAAIYDMLPLQPCHIPKADTGIVGAEQEGIPYQTKP